MKNGNQNHSTPKPLLDAVARLERCLATPRVPGELRAWLQAAAKSFAEAEPRLRQHLERVHADQFKTILNEDPELSHRVIQLKAEDAQLLENLTALRKGIVALEAQCEPAGTDETGLMYKAATEAADRGLDMIIRFRKQEAALATWFVEAFQRDRGAAD